MVRRPLVRVPLPDARGRLALHDAAARRHGSATGARPLDLLLRPPAFLLRILSLRGRFDGLRYWSRYFAWSLFAGLLALVLLCALAIASLPWLVRGMGRYWKPTQRLLYVAAILTVIHGVTVTIHLPHLRAILIVTYGFLVVLVALELRRLDRYVTRPPRRAARAPRHAWSAFRPCPCYCSGFFLPRTITRTERRMSYQPIGRADRP